jgi:ABC-2 type transport system permease protein
MTIGVKMPNLNWINETVPIKQGGAVTIVLFSSWGISILIGGLYMLIGYRMGAASYLALCSAVFACLTLILLHWLNTKGAREFETL